MRHRFEDAEEKQRRVLAIVLEPAAEEAARGLAAGLLEGTVEGPRDSFTALAELKRQKPPPDQRVRAAQQVATFIATHAIDISFGSIPVIGNLANKYFDIAEEQIAERLVAHLPIEAMFGLAHTFSMRLHQTLQPERTQLLRIMIKPAVAADADERFAKAERMTAERMQRLPAGPEKPGPKIEAFER